MSVEYYFHSYSEYGDQAGNMTKPAFSNCTIHCNITNELKRHINNPKCMQIYLMFQVDRFFFGVVPMRYLFLLTSGIGLVRTVRQVFFNGLQGVVI